MASTALENEQYTFLTQDVLFYLYTMITRGTWTLLFSLIIFL